MLVTESVFLKPVVKFSIVIVAGTDSFVHSSFTKTRTITALDNGGTNAIKISCSPWALS